MKSTALTFAAVIALAPAVAHAVTTTGNLAPGATAKASTETLGFTAFTRPGEVAGTLSFGIENDTVSTVVLDSIVFSGANVNGVTLSLSTGVGPVRTVSVTPGLNQEFNYTLDPGDVVQIIADYGDTLPRGAGGFFGVGSQVVSASVPLPASALLLLAALGGATAMRRRKTA